MCSPNPEYLPDSVPEISILGISFRVELNASLFQVIPAPVLLCICKNVINCGIQCISLVLIISDTRSYYFVVCRYHEF